MKIIITENKNETKLGDLVQNIDTNEFGIIKEDNLAKSLFRVNYYSNDLKLFASTTLDESWKKIHFNIIDTEAIIDTGNYVKLGSGEIHKMSDNDMVDYLNSNSDATKKVIATTNTSLSLPQLTEKSIKLIIQNDLNLNNFDIEFFYPEDEIEIPDYTKKIANLFKTPNSYSELMANMNGFDTIEEQEEWINENCTETLEEVALKLSKQFEENKDGFEEQSDFYYGVKAGYKYAENKLKPIIKEQHEIILKQENLEQKLNDLKAKMYFEEEVAELLIWHTKYIIDSNDIMQIDSRNWFNNIKK